MNPSSEAILQHGTRVFSTHTISAKDLDGWVKEVAHVSGQPMAWNRRGYVYVLGDVCKAVSSLIAHREEHDDGFRRACSSSLQPGSVQWTLDHLWAPVRLLAEAFQTLEIERGVRSPSDFGLPKSLGVSPSTNCEGSSTVLQIDLNGDG